MVKNAKKSNQETIMAYTITDRCTACDSCRVVCPRQAIHSGSPRYTINASVCNDCKDQMGGPRCVPACPEVGAILFQTRA